jgi:cyclic pyranopterin phosphate synthase
MPLMTTVFIFTGSSPALRALSIASKIFLTSSGARIGFITPVSERFCAGCQRLRLGPDGKLRICLFDQKGIDLRKELRERGADEERLMRIFREALAEKEFWDRGEMEHNRSEMYKIGG